MTFSAAASPGTRQADDQDLDLAEPWALSPLVALRPEPFGALAYHFGNRRLVFLRRPELVAVVRGLGEAAEVREALLAADIPEGHWPAYAGALAGLAHADVIRRREHVAGAEGKAAP